MDHMLSSMTRILSGLRVNEQRIHENLMRFKDPMMSESVMIALVNKGMPRQEAHRLLQQLVSESQEKKVSFGETLTGNRTITKYLTPEEVTTVLEPKAYIGMSREIVDAAVRKTLSERRARGLKD
jgi:adenylosuccinate lyase